MKKILETERFYLREMDANDAEMMYLLNLDPEVVQYTGDVSFESIEQAREFLENYDHYKVYNMGRWAVCFKDNHEIVGWCGLKTVDDEIDLGYRFFKKYWNMGIGTETAQACLDYGFNVLNLDRIIARAMIENKASYRIMEKISMTRIANTDCAGKEAVKYEMLKENFTKNY